ncbi:unnamed protein product, partial [Rotaria socialis]
MGQSPERFLRPKNEKYDFGAGDPMMNRRSPSTLSMQSSASDEPNELILTNQTNILSNERFQPTMDISPRAPTNNSFRVHSQINNDLSTPINRLSSKPIQQDTHYLVPTPSASISPAIPSRVDLLLSDQKHLEHEIEEQITRLKYDYDDIRKQINRKESSIASEVKSIAANLDQNITEHYQRQQKIYADLASNTNTVGNELKRLKSQTNTDNNKQQLWDNLEKIESHIRNIRQAV